jgi:hypothetical protein
MLEFWGHKPYFLDLGSVLRFFKARSVSFSANLKAKEADALLEASHNELII